MDSQSNGSPGWLWIVSLVLGVLGAYSGAYLLILHGRRLLRYLWAFLERHPRLVELAALSVIVLVVASRTPAPSGDGGADLFKKPAPSPTLASATPEPALSELVMLINGYRSMNGLQPLRTSPALMQASQWMSEDMARDGYFSHTDSQGRDPSRRMADFEYNCATYNTWCGENMVAGSATAWETLDLWTKSPGHDALLLDPHYASIGVGGAYNPDSTHGWYWVLDLGGE